IVVNSGVDQFSYQLNQNGDSYSLTVQLKTKPVIDQINLKTSGEFSSDLPESLPLGFGDFWDEANQDKLQTFLVDYFDTIGYPKAKVLFTTSSDNEYVDIDVDIVCGKPLLLQMVDVESKSKHAAEMFERKIQYLLGKPLNSQELRKEMDDFVTIIKDYGYYSLSVNTKTIPSENEVALLFEIDEGSQFA